MYAWRLSTKIEHLLVGTSYLPELEDLLIKVNGQWNSLLLFLFFFANIIKMMQVYAYVAELGSGQWGRLYWWEGIGNYISKF